MEPKYTAVDDDECRPDEYDRHIPEPQRRPRYLVFFVAIATFTLGFVASTAARDYYPHAPKNPVPKFPKEIVVFHKNTNYSSPPTTENDRLWRDLLGPGQGTVAIQRPSSYGLAAGVSVPASYGDVQIFGVSMYHQLHCLMIIRQTFWRALHGEHVLEEIPSDEKRQKAVDHIGHCFDYIRQGVMCSGDMSIEAAAGEARDRLDGEGQVHECRSWEASRAWMDANVPPQGPPDQSG